MSEHEPWSFNLLDRTHGIHRSLADGMRSRIFFGANVMLSIVEFQPLVESVRHRHTEARWSVVIQGTCTRLQGSHRVAMKEDDFWITPSGVPNTLRAGESGAVILEIFSPARESLGHTARAESPKGDRT